MERNTRRSRREGEKYRYRMQLASLLKSEPAKRVFEVLLKGEPKRFREMIREAHVHDEILRRALQQFEYYGIVEKKKFTKRWYKYSLSRKFKNRYLMEGLVAKFNDLRSVENYWEGSIISYPRVTIYGLDPLVFTPRGKGGVPKKFTEEYLKLRSNAVRLNDAAGIQEDEITILLPPSLKSFYLKERGFAKKVRAFLQASLPKEHRDAGIKFRLSTMRSGPNRLLEQIIDDLELAKREHRLKILREAYRKLLPKFPENVRVLLRRHSETFVQFLNSSDWDIELLKEELEHRFGILQMGNKGKRLASELRNLENNQKETIAKCLMRVIEKCGNLYPTKVTLVASSDRGKVADDSGVDIMNYQMFSLQKRVSKPKKKLKGGT